MTLIIILLLSVSSGMWSLTCGPARFRDGRICFGEQIIIFIISLVLLRLYTCRLIIYTIYIPNPHFSFPIYCAFLSTITANLLCLGFGLWLFWLVKQNKWFQHALCWGVQFSILSTISWTKKMNRLIVKITCRLGDNKYIISSNPNVWCVNNTTVSAQKKQGNWGWKLWLTAFH